MVSVNELTAETEDKVITVTGPDGGQCTAIPHYWQKMLHLPFVYGNAKDTYDNAPDDIYEKTLNAADNFPRAGAIVVWNSNWGNGYGHTGVATWNCDANTLYVLEQNDGDGGVTHVGKHDYVDVIGWFYPRILDQAPAPAPAPPAPVPPVPPAPAPVEQPAPPPVPAPAPVDPAPVSSDSSVTSIPENPVVPVSQPVPTAPEPTPILPPITQEAPMNKLLSRKFLLTVLAVLLAAGGAVSGAVNAGVSLASVTFLVALFNAVEGAIDHKAVQL